MKRFSLVFVLIISLTFSLNAHAISKKKWKDISDYSVYTLMGSALIIPGVKGDWDGFQQAIYSIGAAEAGAQIGKTLIHEQRPDKSDNKSFPSGHSANAFASATYLYKRYGWKAAIPAYSLATLTATARVGAKKHHWWDVVAGAALGTASGWYFTTAEDNKVVLIPWADSKSVGVSFATTF